ncbi:MAG: flavin reductase, partial [Odoribacter splanchnicus]
NKAVAFIFIRPERYTYEFIEKNDMLTLSFLGSGNRSIYNICGSKSGRDTDKIKESGLLPLTTPDGNVTFEQARLTLECRKLYGQLLSPEHFIDKSLPDKWYGAQGNFHKVYVVEILKVWEK